MHGSLVKKKAAVMRINMSDDIGHKKNFKRQRILQILQKLMFASWFFPNSFAELF